MGNVCEGLEHWPVIPGQNCLIQKKGGKKAHRTKILFHFMKRARDVFSGMSR